MATAEEVHHAAEVLARAVQAYYDVANEGEYVTGWTVVAERTSIELEQGNKTVVGTIVPRGQSFSVTRGLLDIGRDAWRNPGTPRDS